MALALHARRAGGEASDMDQRARAERRPPRPRGVPALPRHRAHPERAPAGCSLLLLGSPSLPEASRLVTASRQKLERRRRHGQQRGLKVAAGAAARAVRAVLPGQRLRRPGGVPADRGPRPGRHRGAGARAPPPPPGGRGPPAGAGRGHRRPLLHAQAAASADPGSPEAFRSLSRRSQPRRDPRTRERMSHSRLRQKILIQDKLVRDGLGRGKAPHPTRSHGPQSTGGVQDSVPPGAHRGLRRDTVPMEGDGCRVHLTQRCNPGKEGMSRPGRKNTEKPQAGRPPQHACSPAHLARVRVLALAHTIEGTNLSRIRIFSFSRGWFTCSWVRRSLRGWLLRPRAQKAPGVPGLAGGGGWSLK
ncbi:uncharacterized protein LOC143651330 [Tamandua tetradactyla]|uniref:uncharacterized protein LOC143651330 n=1 Tax=Tamandua tetradactyla TaxID=48850 RepID=UPI0040538DAE